MFQRNILPPFQSQKVSQARNQQEAGSKQNKSWAENQDPIHGGKEVRESQWEQIHCLYKALTKAIGDKSNSTAMKRRIFYLEK
jgi:hypothetical protein